jgi:hypothetical protein
LAIDLTAELFEFKDNADGQLELWIGIKKYPVGLASETASFF